MISSLFSHFLFLSRSPDTPGKDAFLIISTYNMTNKLKENIGLIGQPCAILIPFSGNNQEINQFYS
ncbi:hypothetical protein [Pseudomonas sp. LB3P14]